MKRFFILSTFFQMFSLLVFSQGVGVNESGSTPDPSAGLDVDFTDKGFLPPRLSSEQRDLIDTPATGLTIYNTSTSCLELFANGAWHQIGCACTSAPSVPVGLSHSSTDVSVTWNWSPALGSSGYKWNTSDDFSTATDIGLSNTIIQPGLSCGEDYAIYVWAYNGCGHSTSLTLDASTLVCPYVGCGDFIEVEHSAGNVSPESKTIIYGTVSYAGKCWIDRNLGAENVATAVHDASDEAAGWYWQFNRKQGYYAGPNPAWNTSAITWPGLWEAANDPCTILIGSNWRVATESEWSSADSFGGWGTVTDSYASPLKLHSAGYLYTSDGGLQDRGGGGYYWANAVYSVSDAKTMRVNGGGAGIDNGYQVSGFSIRCTSDL